MATLTVNTVNHPGYDITTNAVAADVAGDTWLNTGAQMAAITNGDVSSKTVTLVYAATFDGASPTNKTIAIPAGHTAIVGPFNPALYNNATTQKASITYSAVTNVTICVFQPGT